MKQVQWLAAGFLALMVAGCGGGGAVAPGGVGGLPIVTTPRIEAVVTNGGNIVTGLDGQPIVHDLRNFQANMEFRLELVGYASDGTRVVLPGEFWSTSDTSAAFGLLASNGGAFTTYSSINTTPQYFSVSYNGTSYSAAYFVKARQILLQGVVRSSTTNRPVKDITVRFYDTFGALVAVSQSAFNGIFRASVPLNAATFQVDSESVPNGYFFNFGYSGSVYQAGSTDCKAGITSGPNQTTPTGFEMGLRDMPDDVFLTPRTATEPTLTPCM